MGKMLIWDTRIDNIVQFCHLQGIESSFAVKKNHNEIVFGDMNCLSSCDRRKMS